MKSTICFLISFLAISNLKARLLFVENTKQTNVKTSYFTGNDSLRCFVIEIFDETKSKYIFIRQYYYHSFKKQKLDANSNLNNSSKNVFEQLNYNQFITKHTSADRVVHKFDSIILVNKSKRILIEGSFFVELFQWKNEATDIVAKSTFNLNCSQQPISNIDSFDSKYFNIYYNDYKNDEHENVLLYKKGNKVAFYRTVTPSRHLITTYTKVLFFKKRKLISFHACFCLFPKGEYLDYYSTDVKYFKRIKIEK